MASPPNRTTARFSTYSGAPSIQPSLAPSSNLDTTDGASARAPSVSVSARTSTYLSPTHNYTSEKTPYNPKAMASTASFSSSTDPKAVDIKSWSGALERMQDSRLEKQRFEMNERKKDEVGKLALGAKVERALARRMVGQDAVFRSKGMDSEKRAAMQVEAR